MELIDLVDSVIIFLSQMTLLRWLIFLLKFLTVTLTVLLFWISFFLLMLAFVVQWLPLHHIFVSVPIYFPSNSKWDATFYHMAYDNSCANWDGLCDHLGDVPWKDINEVSASAVVSEYCEWVHVGIEVNIPHHKYLVKPHSSPWFSTAYAAATVHRNYLFWLVPPE